MSTEAALWSESSVDAEKARSKIAHRFFGFWKNDVGSVLRAESGVYLELYVPGNRVTISLRTNLTVIIATFVHFPRFQKRGMSAHK